MAFFNGNTDLDALLNLWATQLIATGSWVDNDPTWNGTKRSLRHAVDPNFFIAFERGVNNLVRSGGGSGGSYNALEIRIVVSSAWVANAPSGTIRYSGIVSSAGWSLSSGGINSNIPSGVPANASATGQHWTWVDADGLVSLFKPTASAFWDFTSCFILDRITAKEFADGGTNFYTIAFNNFDALGSETGGASRRYYDASGNYTSSSNQSRVQYIHAFLVEEYNANGAGAPSFPLNTVERWFPAYRSPGNSKVYVAFPWYFNTTNGTQRTPITGSGDKWWRSSQALGLADGDVIDYTAPGPILKRYLVKSLDSPDTTSAIDIALRFA